MILGVLPATRKLPFGKYKTRPNAWRQSRFRWSIDHIRRWNILPESYLYGLMDVRLISDSFSTYIFGKVYARGVWFYFPAAFIIKSTAAFMGLLMLAGFAIVTRKLHARREIFFLTIPPVLYLLIATGTGLNIGARHILPMYPFLAVLIGGAALALA